MGCVWVYMEKVELRYWWEHSDEKNMNKLPYLFAYKPSDFCKIFY